MNCEQAQLQSHWPEALQRGQQEQLTQHVDSCTRCQDVLAELEALNQMVQVGVLSYLEPQAQEIPTVEESFAKLAKRLRLPTDAALAPMPLTPSAQREVLGASTQAPSWQERLRRLVMDWMFRPSRVLMAAALAILLLLPWSLKLQVTKQHTQGASDYTMKGAKPSVTMLYAHPKAPPVIRHSPPRPVQPGQVLHPGDLIQFRYELPHPMHAMIVSFNQQGTPFAFFPFRGHHSQTLQSGQGTLPPRASFELDDYIGQERLFVVMSRQPFSYTTLLKTLKKTFGPQAQSQQAQHPLPKGWIVKSFRIQKRKTSQHP